MQIHYHQIFSPQLNRHRIIRVLLPKNYHSSTSHRYPVIYMQDGQNLFEASTAAFHPWNIPQIMEKQPLYRQAIIVGIDHGGIDRVHEYAPFKRGKSGGQGDLYLKFLIETIKPFIDNRYPTKPFREDTVIAGSSMGGLIALYGGLKYGQYFGKTVAMSPSIWFNPKILELSKYTEWKSKIYAVSSQTEMRSMATTMQQLYWSLKNNGFQDPDIRIILRDKGKHNEVFWRKEFKKMLEWIFINA